MLFKYFVIKLGFLERKFKKKLLTHITLPAFKCIRHCLLKDTRLLARKSGGGVFGFCCFSNLFSGMEAWLPAITLIALELVIMAILSKDLVLF